MTTINEQLYIKGEVTIIKYDIDGNITDKRKIPNMVVTIGKNFIASRMVGATSAVMTHMAVGTGNAVPVTGNLALGAQSSTRVALTSTTVGTGANLNVITYVATFAAGVSTGSIQEAGIFNHATDTAVSMLCRTTFPVVVKAPGDSIVITWVITVS